MSLPRRMPWGKHQGKRLADVPASYLCWVLEESNADRSLKNAVCKELADRFATTHEQPAAQSCYRCNRVAGELESVFRKASLVCHPDRGGTHDSMQALNEFRDRLVVALRN